MSEDIGLRFFFLGHPVYIYIYVYLFTKNLFRMASKFTTLILHGLVIIGCKAGSLSYVCRITLTFFDDFSLH